MKELKVFSNMQHTPVSIRSRSIEIYNIEQIPVPTNSSRKGTSSWLVAVHDSSGCVPILEGTAVIASHTKIDQFADQMTTADRFVYWVSRSGKRACNHFAASFKSK